MTPAIHALAVRYAADPAEVQEYFDNKELFDRIARLMDEFQDAATKEREREEHAAWSPYVGGEP